MSEDVRSLLLERHSLMFSARLEAKRVVEALLFASNTPLPFAKIRHIVEQVHPFTPRELLTLIQELQIEYESQQRAFEIVEIAEGYALRTRKEFGSYVDQLFGNKRPEKLSQAATEVLAIVAYRQPITRPQIEALRGVDSSGVLQSLLERQLVEAVGKLETPGRPTLYAVTHQFLEHFGLKSLADLPSPATIP
ncbi:MAG: SMC-Scp complex subunit ScpB [Chlamydiales bacterium]|nr:SMC-Scp complex subunit ScpB [Chlamydiales bacterium]